MSRVRDIVALVKPRITLMVVATGVVGLYLAPQTPPPETKLGLLIGMSLLVGGANALNMYLERDIDGRAERTKNRPLPAGRLEPSIALSLGLSLGVLAMLWLAVVVNLLTAGLGLLAFVAYTAVYTPMKQYSPGALVVGAVPGAMPPLMGWTAATGQLDLAGLTLFAIISASPARPRLRPPFRWCCPCCCCVQCRCSSFRWALAASSICGRRFWRVWAFCWLEFRVCARRQAFAGRAACSKPRCCI